MPAVPSPRRSPAPGGWGVRARIWAMAARAGRRSLVPSRPRLRLPAAPAEPGEALLTARSPARGRWGGRFALVVGAADNDGRPYGEGDGGRCDGARDRPPADAPARRSTRAVSLRSGIGERGSEGREKRHVHLSSCGGAWEPTADALPRDGFGYVEGLRHVRMGALVDDTRANRSRLVIWQVAQQRVGRDLRREALDALQLVIVESMRPMPELRRARSPTRPRASARSSRCRAMPNSHATAGSGPGRKRDAPTRAAANVAAVKSAAISASPA